MDTKIIVCDEFYNTETTKYNNALKSLKQKLAVDLDKTNKMNISKQNKYNRMIMLKNAYNNAVKLSTTSYNQTITNLYTQFMKTRNKKALLCGLNYIGTPNELFGCINDTNNIKNLLESGPFNYNYFNILTDKTNKKPRKQNIILELTNLLVYSNEGDRLFFLYSGHGTCTADLNRDESDGRDELIVPLDANSIGTCILDDDIKKIITKYLKKGVTLFMLFDSCFSGTIVDLKYNFLVGNGTGSGSDSLIENTNTTETLGQIIVISGCKDSQTSADAYVTYSGKNMYSGAMTYSFLKTIQDLGTNISLSNLVTNMRNVLATDGYEQIPQLSSGTNININMTIPFL